MLSRAENARITHVGPGTFMGDLLREFWLPVLLTQELPAADDPPLRVRVLGEDLVAFRDSGGNVGLLSDHCPHRGASMFFGRNEEHGLRCVYHGWKFNIAGACVDMPNEPAESNFKHKIKAVAYQCQERNGVIWAYMGGRFPLPSLPDLEWSLVSEPQRFISKTLQDCNWVQAVEGGIDTSHGPFLHHGLVPGQRDPEIPGIGVAWVDRDRSPRFEVVDTDYGLLIGAQRDYDPNQYSYGITQFLMPFYTMLPGGMDERGILSSHAWVPMDDERTITWTMSWCPRRNMTEAELMKFNTYPQSQTHVGANALLPPTSAPMGAWRPIPNKSNDYFIDREVQRTRSYTGIGVTESGRNSRVQDDAIQESMGHIYDRVQEHLGTTDLAIIRARRLWLQAGRALRDQDTPPPMASAPTVYRVRSAKVLVPRAAPQTWIETSREARKAEVVAVS